MEIKKAKNNSATNLKLKSIRISLENQKKAEKILSSANKKKLGRKVKFDQLLSLVLDLVTEEHIKKLQDQSLTNEDRKEILRQKYSELHGPITKDAFVGVMLTKEFSEFLNATLAEKTLQLSAS
jgi:hypothetical protein